jgi:hypothetical protein
VLGSKPHFSPRAGPNVESQTRSDILLAGHCLFELPDRSKPFDGETPPNRVQTRDRTRAGLLRLLRSNSSRIRCLVVRSNIPDPDLWQRNGAELLDELSKIRELDPKRFSSHWIWTSTASGPNSKTKSSRPEARIGNTLVTKVRNFTQPLSLKRDEIKPIVRSDGKLEETPVES